MADLNKIIDELSKLTVVEAAELSKQLEEKWGVTAAAAVAAPAAGAAAGGAPAEEKNEFTVVLASAGDKKINVIKEVRAADSREELGVAIRALDRILRNKVIWVPQWFKNKHTIAYYDMFEHPNNLPPYDIGVLDTWWMNSDKYKDLKDQGALK